MEAEAEAAVEERRDTDSLARRRSAARCRSPLLSANARLRHGQDSVRVGGAGMHGGGRGGEGGTRLEEGTFSPRLSSSSAPGGGGLGRDEAHAPAHAGGHAPTHAHSPTGTYLSAPQIR